MLFGDLAFGEIIEEIDSARDVLVFHHLATVGF